MQGGVRIGAAHRLLVSRDNIIMVVAQLVVPHGSAHGYLLHHGKVDGAGAVLDRRSGDGKLQVAQGLAHIAARTLGQVVQCVVRDQNRRLVVGPQAGYSVLQALADVGGGQCLELKHRAA